MKSQTIIVFLLIALGMLGYLYYKKSAAQVVLPYPYAFTKYHTSKTEWSCKGQVVTGIHTNDIGDKNLTANIGTSKETLDNVAIGIDGNNLKFITGSSVDLGVTDNRPLTIIENTFDRLVAIDRDVTGASKPIDVFILNKSSGMAIWTRALSFFMSKDPTGELEYFVCN